MKRKIISLIVISMLIFLCFTVQAFAIYDYGENYDRSEIYCGGCSNTGCQYCGAYDYGYNDGVLDGQKTGFVEGGTYYEENVLPGLIQAAIDDYKNTDEYQAEFDQALLAALEQYKDEFYNSLAEARQEAVEDYKNSQEFIDVKNEQYSLGEQAGLETGLIEGEMNAAQKHYNLGYTDGKHSYMLTEEYEQSLQQSANYGYEYGYNDGLEDGSNRENNDDSLMKIILSVIISLAVVIVVFIVLSLIIKKVKRKKKK